MTQDSEARPAFMRFIRRFAVPILVAWLLLTVAVNVLIPPIESVARDHAVTMSPQDAPAMIAAKRIGATYHESDSDSIAMVVLEGDRELGDEARRFYDTLVRELHADPEHVQHVQDVWGDPLTAAGYRVATAKPPTCSSISPGTRAARQATPPSKRCERSSLVRLHRRV
ncbi:hypothetical protein MMAD_50530 [Mycolicibacterium madagascariense]|uniref:Membrane transport protein MMPL domain-containing protein n=1 Tax=Mycolicibacterium madagascariense TaxID=212765 RepID=A0A7I7XND8_9MYCO|nr:hypothetical protein MMAD_50530 [Mycolicibacterium madagascariense]